MIKRYKGKKFAYYQCESCGKQISSEEYYLYRKCNVCRWLWWIEKKNEKKKIPGNKIS